MSILGLLVTGAGPELGWPGVVWMRDRFGLGWGEEMRAEAW